MDDFIVPDNKCDDEIDSARFYRNFENIRSFQNQQKNTIKQIDRNKNLYFGEDGQPEMFSPENADDIEFHDFTDY